MKPLNIMLVLAVCFCTGGMILHGWYLQEGAAGSELEGSEPAEAAPAATVKDGGSLKVYWLEEPVKRVVTDAGVRREADKPIEIWINRPTLDEKPYETAIRSSDKQTSRMTLDEAVVEFARAYGEGLAIGSKIRSGRIFSNRESEAAEIPTPAINAR